MRRILQVEREFTEGAARRIADPKPLIEHSERRSKALCGEYVKNPMDMLPGLNRVWETMEELADARNHLVFYVQENLGDEELLTELQIALGYIVAAYERLARI